jgi:hypothetical protein
LERCPNIATIALKLKLSHTTPPPPPEQLHALFAPLIVVALLLGDGVVVVGEAVGKAAKERASG